MGYTNIVKILSSKWEDEKANIGIEEIKDNSINLPIMLPKGTHYNNGSFQGIEPKMLPIENFLF
jgi:hypothetical protein